MDNVFSFQMSGLSTPSSSNASVTDLSETPETSGSSTAATSALTSVPLSPLFDSSEHPGFSISPAPWNISHQHMPHSGAINSQISLGIATADHSTLLRAQNHAYYRLYQQNSDLQQQIRKLTEQNLVLTTESSSYKNAYILLAESLKSLSSSTLAPAASASAPMQTFLASLPATTSLETVAPPLKSEHPKVQYWQKQDWVASKRSKKGVSNVTDIKNKQKGKRDPEVNTSMTYVQDVNGVAIDGHKAGAIRSHAYGIWEALVKAGFAPVTWGRATPAIKEQYQKEMKRRFPELALCEDDWKADQIATDNYPSFHSNRYPELHKKKARRGGCMKTEAGDAEDHGAILNDKTDHDHDDSMKSDLENSLKSNTECRETLSPRQPVDSVHNEPGPATGKRGHDEMQSSNLPAAKRMKTPLSLPLMDDEVEIYTRDDSPIVCSVKGKEKEIVPLNIIHPLAGLFSNITPTTTAGEGSAVSPAPSIQARHAEEVPSEGFFAETSEATLRTSAADFRDTTSAVTTPALDSPSPATGSAIATENTESSETSTQGAPLESLKKTAKAPGSKPTYYRPGAANNAKNNCGRSWKTANRGGTKDDFEMHWNGLSEEQQKAYEQPVSATTSRPRRE